MRERASAALVAGWVFADLLLVLFIAVQGDTMAAEPPPPTTTVPTTTEPITGPPPPSTTAPQYAKPVAIVIPDVSISWFDDAVTPEDQMRQQELANRIATEMDRLGLDGKPNGRIQIFGQSTSTALSDGVAELMRQHFREETAGTEILPFLGTKGPTTITIEFFVVAS